MPPPVVRVPKYIGRGAFLDVPAYAGNASMALVVNGAGNGFQYVSVALAAHAHDAADITSGTIADARIASTITRDSEVMTIVLAGDGSGSGLDADLLRGVTPSVYGLTLIDDADAATARATLGLGALATAGVPGSTTQVIFNSAGALAGDAGMTYDAANDALTVAGRVVTPKIVVVANSTNAGGFYKADGTSQDFYYDSTNGRIGIGTIPSALLHAKTLDSSVNAVVMRLQGPGGNIDFTANDGSGRTAIIAKSLTGGTGATGTLNLSSCTGNSNRAYIDIGTNDIRIFTTGSTATERIRIGYGTTVGGVYVGGGVDPTAVLDVAASTTARASLRIRSGTAPTSPNAGDMWFDGTNLKFYDGLATKTITWT